MTMTNTIRLPLIITAKRISVKDLSNQHYFVLGIGLGSMVALVDTEVITIMT